jgi:hypothetical protein
MTPSPGVVNRARNTSEYGTLETVGVVQPAKIASGASVAQRNNFIPFVL